MLLAHPRVFGNSTTADSLNFKWATRNVPKIQALHMDSRRQLTSPGYEALIVHMLGRSQGLHHP